METIHVKAKNDNVIGVLLLWADGDNVVYGNDGSIVSYANIDDIWRYWRKDDKTPDFVNKTPQSAEKWRNTAYQYVLYLLRWQLSSPLLALCLWWLGGIGVVWATIISNLIGGLAFFWLDKLIFKGDRDGR